MTEQDEPSLPNIWRINNLRLSPYFEDELATTSQEHPLSLFVGRAAEVQALIAGIGGAFSSRQAIGGPPGIGKTTLVEEVKERAIAAGYIATERISMIVGDTAELTIGRILAGIFESVLSLRPHTIADPAMQEAQQLVKAFRMSGGGFTISAFGVGGGASTSQAVVTAPNALTLSGPKAIAGILTMLRATGEIKGVLLHLNNLENLADGRQAAEIFRSLRDPVLMQPGLHVLLVGTTDAIREVATSSPQLRSVITTPLILEPLTQEQVVNLLAARYRHLALDPGKSVVPPVDDTAVEALYPLFRGDLRGLFKALEEGARLLLGVADSGIGQPIKELELRAVLTVRYRKEMEGQLKSDDLARLDRWGSRSPEKPVTQSELEEIWGIGQGATSKALKTLTAKDYVIALPRDLSSPPDKGRRRRTQYLLTGQARLLYN